MKAIKLALLTFTVTALLLSACSVDSSPDTEPGMTGYVMKIEGERILVVDPEPLDFSATGGLDEFYNAIFFSKSPDQVQVGDQVKVWFDMVADSYPGQSEALYLEIIAPPQPVGATLNQSEALRAALESLGPEAPAVALKTANYDPAKDHWVIELNELHSGEIQLIELEDN